MSDAFDAGAIDLVAAVIGRAHGLRGEVTLDVRTDRVEQRLRPGTRFETEPAEAGPLTLTALRSGPKGYLAQFAEATTRSDAELLRGVQVLVRADAEADAWYPHELEGLTVVLPDGSPVGRVRSVEFGSAQDLLVIEREGQADALVPLLSHTVPVVDPSGGRIVIDPPDGLLA